MRTSMEAFCVIFFVILCPTIRGDDFSGKVSVKVSELLSQSHPSQVLQIPPSPPHPKSWDSSPTHTNHPSSNSEYSVVNIRVLGEIIDATTLQKLKPTGRFINPNKLKHLLGQHFDESWMAMNVPPSQGRFARHPTMESDPALINLVNKMNFTFVDSSGVTLEMQPTLLEHVRSWMLQRASCPMDFIWEDLGPLFWPRWIKRGVCLNTHSCSWPPGMICRATGTKEIKLLRWACAVDPGEKLKQETEASLQEMRRRGDRRRKQRSMNNVGWNSRFRGYNYPSSQGRMSRGVAVSPQRSAKVDDASREQRRAKRIIQKLSMSAEGYFCQWQEHKYIISDQCSCTCP